MATIPLRKFTVPPEDELLWLAGRIIVIRDWLAAKELFGETKRLDKSIRVNMSPGPQLLARMRKCAALANRIFYEAAL